MQGSDEDTEGDDDCLNCKAQSVKCFNCFDFCNLKFVICIDIGRVDVFNSGIQKWIKDRA